MKLLAGVVELFSTFLNELFSTVGLTLDLIFYLGIGFEVLMIIFFLIKSRFAYEGRLSRHLDKLNKWLYYNQNIDSNNLIEFNNRMKKSPKTLRYYWQQYMLYREHSPSHYMSTYNCIEKPLHTSSYDANMKNLQAINWATMIVTFVLGLAADLSTTNILSTIATALIVPMIVCVLSTIFLMILRTMQNYNLSSLYQNFHLFQRYIDKATTTLPEYVDFEVLFTQNEIKKGIPVLNEYLEKRARQEQEELEKARLYAVEHEKYDFSKSGINGALVLDRAMKETEIYLNIRQRLLSEIQQLESEIDSKKRNYENVSKDYQRKMQASKENVERLRTQQEETTNRIESNYIKKQQGDEIKKQEQLDKDQEDATVKFNHEIEALQTEIEKRREDLNSRKNYVEEAMLAEYQTFSEKLYKQVAKAVEVKADEEKKEILDEKDAITNELNQANNTITVLNKEIENLKKVIENAGIEEGQHGGFYSSALKEEAERVRVGKHNTKTENVVAEQPVEKVEQPAEQIEETTEYQKDENGGYYDDKGYYWFANGTYYDDKGNYYDEVGGHYDADGNYFPPESQSELESKEQKVQEVEQPQVLEEPQQTEESVETPAQENTFVNEEEPQLDEYGGYYDEQGYYRYPNGTYYDTEGNFFDELGGHYDASGNYYPPEESTEEQVDNNVENGEKLEQVEVQETTKEPVEETSGEKTTQELSTEENGDDEDGTMIFDFSDDELGLGIQAEIEEEEVPAEQLEKVDEQPVEPVEEHLEQPVEETVSQEESVEEKPKKKPGRPRKIVDESQPKEKRGRGRPRKEPAIQTESTEKKGRGRPRKETVEQVEETPKKKPGRPRKETVEQVEETPKKKPGRPKKVDEEPVAQEKRGRGRPKKEVEEQTEPAEKRGRGRPKKEVTETATPTVKRGRGRPRKTLNQEVDELSAISKKIQEEQAKILKEQKELSDQLDIALNKIADKEENE